MIKGELFSQQFIPKLLDGTKIRTSRPIKIEFLPGFNPTWTGYRPVFEYGEFFLEGSNHRDATKRIKPKHQPGDIIYARETWTHNDYEGFVDYRADFTDLEAKGLDIKWRPSIHMPREAARIFLRVTDVRAQRLDELTEQDAEQDGFKAYSLIDGADYMISALDQFKQFWLNQYGSDAKWMWVYHFERISKEEAYAND